MRTGAVLGSFGSSGGNFGFGVLSFDAKKYYDQNTKKGLFRTFVFSTNIYPSAITTTLLPHYISTTL